MGKQITIIEASGELLIQFPFALRESFLTVFKTAQWNATRRGYVVKATTMNRNKAEKFKQLAADTVAALDAADETDMLEQDVKALRVQLAQVQADAATNASRSEALRQEAARIRELLSSEQGKADAAIVALRTAQADVDAALEPVKRLCAELGVNNAISTLRAHSRRSFLLAEQKGNFNDACRALLAANAKLAETLKIRLPALHVLGEANYNRLDKLRDALVRFSDVYEGIEAVTEE